MLSKLFDLIKSGQRSFFLAACLGLIAFISYNLGRIDALEKTPITISKKQGSEAKNGDLRADIYSASRPESGSQKPETELDTRVVVAKSSASKKYHYSWCAGAKKIKPENQIWFNSSQEAETAGYTLAGNCQ